MALTDKQRRFVDEYLIDLNATRASIRAGYSENRASEIGYQLLQKTTVQAHLSQRRKDLAAKTAITPEVVLQRWWDIANVDVNEIVEYRRQNCRYCWGIEHNYQWTHAEYEKAQREAGEKGKETPDCEGGFGFDHHREPNPACPECGGDGIGKIHVHDTRHLKGGARALYAGVHHGKDGLKVLLEERGKALENVARHLGMFKDKVELTGKDGAPLEVKTAGLDALKNLTDEQLAQLESIAAAVAGPGGDKGRESTPPSR